jgi:hypothetical protein
LPAEVESKVRSTQITSKLISEEELDEMLALDSDEEDGAAEKLYSVDVFCIQPEPHDLNDMMKAEQAANQMNEEMQGVI